MDDGTKKILLFIGGVIWAMRSSTKAYAPTIIHTSSKKPKSQGDCEQDELYREGEWIGETLTDNRCVSSCDRGEKRIDTSTTNTMGIYGPEAYFNCVPNPNASIQVEGGSCMSSFGPGHIEWNEPNPSRGLRRRNVGGDCYKCPDEVLVGRGMPPYWGPNTGKPSPFQKECIDKGFSKRKMRPS